MERTDQGPHPLPASSSVSRIPWVLVLAFGFLGFAAAPRAAAAEKPLFGYDRLWVANGCFVESVACYDAFHETSGADGWARVLQWGAREEEVMVAGHAVAVFESDGALWCWDVNHGWMLLPVAATDRDNAAVVSVPILANYPRVTALYPMLADDGAQEPAAGPPGAEASAGAEGAHDARLVAVRLARHRPVNLIEVSQVENGVSRTSEAVVFAFGGRMCLYSPESGTTTFRTRSSVWNVRLTLEMARRIFPGVERVQSIALPAPGSN